MKARIARKVFSADAIGLLLVLIALQALTYGLSASLGTTETSDLAYFFWICLFSVLLALGLRKRNINGFFATGAIIVSGILGLWILGARLTGPVLDLGREILSMTPQIIPAYRSHVPVDTTGIVDAWRLVVEASNALNSARAALVVRSKWKRQSDRSTGTQHDLDVDVVAPRGLDGLVRGPTKCDCSFIALHRVAGDSHLL